MPTCRYYLTNVKQTNPSHPQALKSAWFNQFRNSSSQKHKKINEIKSLQPVLKLDRTMYIDRYNKQFSTQNSTITHKIFPGQVSSKFKHIDSIIDQNSFFKSNKSMGTSKFQNLSSRKHKSVNTSN